MSVQAGAVSGSVATGLPVANQALEPQWVRDGSDSTKKAYASALSFEQTLVEQLSQTLTATSGLEGESSSGEAESSSEEDAPGSNMGGSQLSSLLPQALSSGVMHAGGLGLAAQMTRDLEGTNPALETGGTVQASASGSAGSVPNAATANPEGAAPADVAPASAGTDASAGVSGGTPA
jgi:hypothetical protein